MTEHSAIGIFDSGVGGLTVVRRIMERLPGERTVYLGDTARVPYGTKSPDTVVRYARACADILLDHGIKLMVVACNTASAFAIHVLQQELEIPVLGVIEPGAEVAVHKSRSGRIGVIGTAGTIRSGQYVEAIRNLEPKAQVFTKPCPLFVPLAEEGWTAGDVPRQVAESYLKELMEEQIDALVLGCTHYPLLKRVIGEVVGPDVALVDSAEATAAIVEQVLGGLGLLAPAEIKPEHRYLVSDDPDSFERIGRAFLGRPLSNVEWVDF